MTSWNIPTWTDIKERAASVPSSAKTSWDAFSCRECLASCRTSNKMIVFIVFIAIFLDNMLMTTVVPIIPSFLFETEHPYEYQILLHAKNGTLKDLQRETCVDLATFANSTTANYIGNHDSEINPNFLSNITFLSSSGVESIGKINKNCTYFNITADSLKSMSEKKLSEQSLRTGLLFASKAFIQLLVNPLVGLLTNKYGYSIPMFTGFVVMFVSTIVFAFGRSYWVLLIARGVQGAGSSCSSVAGMGMIADKYQDDRERGNAMAIALSGLALGVLLGPPFGGVFYEWFGKECPFIVLAGLALFDGILQLCVLKPKKSAEAEDGPSMISLLKDPYILLAAGALCVANMGIAMLEPTLPQFMFKHFYATKWEQGVAFLPASISYLIGTNIFGPLSHKIGRWLAALFGMVIISMALLATSFSQNLAQVMGAGFFNGFAIGMVDSSMMPQMGYLVDLRHISIYGGVYAIADVAFCLGFAAGPALGGSIEELIGFRWMLRIIVIINILFAPLLYFLKDPPGNEEKMLVITDKTCPIKYVTYRQTSYDDVTESVEVYPSAYPSAERLNTEEGLPMNGFTLRGTSFQTTGVVHHVEEEDSSESGETQAADSDPEADSSSSESEYNETSSIQPRNYRRHSSSSESS